MVLTFVFLNYHWSVNPHALFPQLVSGEAYHPYVGRALMPFLIRSVSEFTPDAVKEALSSSLQASGVFGGIFRAEYSLELITAAGIIFVCFFLLLYSLRSLANNFYPTPAFVSDFSPIVGVLVLLLFFVTYDHYIYDPSTLFLFTISVVFICRRRYLFFYPMFVLAALNKETTVLLIGIFFLHEFETMKRLTLARHLVFQSTLWAGIRGLIAFRFRGNPGSFLEFHLLDHTLVIFQNLRQLAYVMIVAAFVAVVILYGWKSNPRFVQRSFFFILGTQVLIAAFFGFVEEIRAYYEVFPFVFLLGLSTMTDIFEINSAGQVTPGNSAV